MQKIASQGSDLTTPIGKTSSDQFEADEDSESDHSTRRMWTWEKTLIRKIITTKIKNATFHTNRHDKDGEGGGVPPLPVQLEGVDSTRRA